MWEVGMEDKKDNRRIDNRQEWKIQDLLFL